MAQERVDVRNKAVRQFLATFEGDADVFRDCLHPDIEWFPIEENRTPTRGLEAAMWNRNQWLDTWDEHSFEVQDIVEKGDDVVATVHIRARGKVSGVETDLRFYAQFKVRDGKIVYVYDHDDKAAALKAAGLSE